MVPMSVSNALREAFQESEKSEVLSTWFRNRMDALRESVSAHDVLRYFHVSLHYEGSGHQEQISCPFHGNDRRPSARVYPQEGTSSSGLYCYVCRKRWDIVGLWKEFSGDPTMRFTYAISGLESAFGIIVPDAPSFEDLERDNGPSQRALEVAEVVNVCERRLRQGKSSFEMAAFFTIGRLLDQLHYAMNKGSLDLDEIERRARLLLDKIGEKIRNA
jgi:hypothetical protein